MGVTLKLYKRYVDDLNLVVVPVPRGTKYCEGRVVIESSQSTDFETEKPDERTMKLLLNIANDIHPSIQFEIDYPSKNIDHKVPILDLKVWTEEREVHNEVGNVKKTVILHEFYTKNVSSKAVINARSSLPWKRKRQILTREMLRVLLNCNTMLPWGTIARHASEMVKRLQYSGYTHKFRCEVVASALKAYKSILDGERRGLRPLYRSRGWKRQERQEVKVRKKREWFKKDGSDSIDSEFVAKETGTGGSKEK